MRRWITAIAAAVVGISGTLVAPVHLASAADRPELRSIIAGARQANQATAKVIPRLTVEDARLARERLGLLRDRASVLSDALSGSSGPVSPSLQTRIRTLGSQASALRAGADAASAGMSVLGEVRRLALEGLRQGIDGGFRTNFDAEQYRWSAAGAHALADLTVARAAMTSLTPPRRAASARKALQQALAGVTPAPVAGWIPLPGGCALPPASMTDYLPAPGTAAPRLWTTPQGIDAHRAQLASPTPALSAAYAKTMRQATVLSLQSGEPGGVSEVTKRVLTVGYAWLMTSDAAYHDALMADARMLTDAKPREAVDEAKEALVLATAVDWLSASRESVSVDGGPSTLEAARQVLKIRTMGSIGCSLALGETIAVDKLNKSVIIGSGVVMSALALADDPLWRPGLAAAVRAGLAGARSGLDVLNVDGGSPEGPVYWNFQTVPAAGLLSSIDATLPSRTVARVPSLVKAGRFALQMAAPALSGDRETTRYSDARDTVLRCTLPAWIAGRYGDPDAITVAIEGQLRQGVELLWWPRDEVNAPVQDAAFPASGVAVLRSGDATAWLLGQPELTNHTQLDAGGVTVRVSGVDWSLDAGYGVEGPGYSEDRPDGRRWTYPQTQPAWHSTVRTVVSASDVGQVVGATAPVALRAGSAVVDLTRVLQGATQAQRRISLTASQLTIVDTIRGKQQPYAWSWITQASVRVAGTSIELSADGRKAALTFDSLPPGARITTTLAPGALGMPGTRIQVEVPAAREISIVARLAWET